MLLFMSKIREDKIPVFYIFFVGLFLEYLMCSQKRGHKILLLSYDAKMSNSFTSISVFLEPPNCNISIKFPLFLCTCSSKCLKESYCHKEL